VLGSIPFSFFILLDHNRRDTINKKEAKAILRGKSKSSRSLKEGVYSIVTDLKNETFTFEDQHFTHAIAEGNYTDFYFIEESRSKSVTYRISLSSFEMQLEGSNLKRCHRSYLVNLNHVSNVSGNAQGLKLSLTDSPFEIPVSRKYIPAIKEYFFKVSQ